MVSVPYGVMPTAGRPRARASHSASPSHGGHVDLVGQLAGEADPADPRRRCPATSASRQAMNGKPSLSTARPGASAAQHVAGARARRAATVAHCSVTEVQCTRSSGHSVCSHSSIQSSTAAALPVVVVTRKRSSARRMTVPSSKTMPSGRHITPYRIVPTFSVLIMLV